MIFNNKEFSCYNDDFIGKLNTLYNKTNAYLDKHFESEVKQNKNKLCQRITEMMIISKLIDAGINLSKNHNSAPDVDVLIDLDRNEQVWIECVTPSIGKSQVLKELPNKIESCSEFVEIPYDDLAPRITSVVVEKSKKYKKHISMVKTKAMPILIINTSLLPVGFDQRYIGLFEGWKDPHVIFSRNSNDDHSNQLYVFPSDKIIKPDSKASIPTKFFSQNDFPFQIVILSGEMISCFSSQPLNIELINPKYLKTIKISQSITKIRNALKSDIDWSQY
ncbi:MAG: hypothetical protein EP298_00020 [Gammaproteobacteria bacterium]|nr:MAG: hypothetical protein EP298_00020 [Gammaproteobacteria bacterium]UTW43618.1 hypothetical protein KFE69_05880 [bacterium SCSIO 12844]